MLRLFNDPVSMLFVYAAILVWTSKNARWTNGTLLFSMALSIKMNVLLFLPGLLFIFWTRGGLSFTIRQIIVLATTQVLIASPFVTSSELATSYFRRAFDFSREFLWEWTVNWRWLGEEVFEEPSFARVLLLLHLVALVIFGVRWADDFGGVLHAIKAGFKGRKQHLSADRKVSDCLQSAADASRSHRDHSLHLESDWRVVRSLSSLPILFLVGSSARLSRLAYTIRDVPEARALSSYRVWLERLPVDRQFESDARHVDGYLARWCLLRLSNWDQ